MNRLTDPGERPILNTERFVRMSCGDLPGFEELADEYFAELRGRLKSWPEVVAAGDHRQLAEDFHRCKGGAAMFGLERLHALFGEWEMEQGGGQSGPDLERFAAEVAAAEAAVADFLANAADVCQNPIP